MGLFKYYELKQLPNFILAAPILGLTLAGVTEFAKASPTAFFTLGLSRTSQPDGALASVYLWGGMAAIALVAMHVQVATRFLSVCPPLYWYCAAIERQGGGVGRAVWTFFLLYATLGALLFPNGYPWVRRLDHNPSLSSPPAF